MCPETNGNSMSCQTDSWAGYSFGVPPGQQFVCTEDAVRFTVSNGGRDMLRVQVEVVRVAHVFVSLTAKCKA